jgi:hypothetical protein
MRHSIITQGISPVDDLFGVTHYSPLGNQLVARYILQYMHEQKLVHNDGVKLELRAARLRSETGTNMQNPTYCTMMRAKDEF